MRCLTDAWISVLVDSLTYKLKKLPMYLFFVDGMGCYISGWQDNVKPRVDDSTETYEIRRSDNRVPEYLSS